MLENLPFQPLLKFTVILIWSGVVKNTITLILKKEVARQIAHIKIFAIAHPKATCVDKRCKEGLALLSKQSLQSHDKKLEVSVARYSFTPVFSKAAGNENFRIRWRAINYQSFHND